MTTLSGMTWDDPRGRAPLVALAGTCGPHGATSVTWSARSLQAFAGYPRERLVEDYDLLVIDHPHIPLVAGEGLLVALDETGCDDELALLAAQAVGFSHASYTHGSHQYALAIDAAAQVSVHRPDLIAAPPLDWDGVMELAGEGRVLWPGIAVDAMSSFLTLAAQRGDPACSRPGCFVGQETGLSVLELLHLLSDRVGRSCLVQNPIDVAEALATDERWCYAPLLFGYVNYSRAGFRKRRLAYRDMPWAAGEGGVSGSCLGGAGIAVSARCKEREAAVAYAFWLASGEVQRGRYYWEGGQPGNALAWEDPAIDADSFGFFTGTRATLEGAWVRPRYRGWMALQERVGELVHATLSGDVSDEACLAALDSEADRLLGGETFEGGRGGRLVADQLPPHEKGAP